MGGFVGVCVCGGGGGCYVCIWYLPSSSLGLGYDLALQLAFGVSVVLKSTGSRATGRTAWNLLLIWACTFD